MTNPICILILEDNPSDFELVKRELRSAFSDFTVEWANDKETFLQALDKFVPDLILLDYSLPGFDGLGALALARQRFPDMPAIIVSGAIGEEVAIEALKAGATDYVLKQHLSRLGPVIRRALAEAEQLTERKLAEEALRESEQRWATTLASIGDAVIATDLEGRLTFMNAVAEDLTGWTLSEASMKPVTEVFNIINEFTRQRVQDPVAKVIEKGMIVGLANHTILVRKDRTEVPIDDSGAPIMDRNGNITGVVLVFRDITDRKRAEDQLRASLAEKEVLLKEIHHRVKNNMQVISSLISLQADRPADPATARILEDLRGRVRTMALVHEKLYLSQDISRIDFAEYALSLLRFIWQANVTDAARVELRLELQPLLLSVEAAVPCGLILNELATNALKHAFRGRDGGVVTVSLTSGADGRACLKVSDNGIGLPADLDWQQSQTLGLQLVSMLTRQLNGTVEVRKGEGTEFRIAFGSKRAENEGEGKPI